MKDHKIPIDSETYAILEAIGKVLGKTVDQISTIMLKDLFKKLKGIDHLKGKEWSAAFNAILHGKD